MSFEIAIKQILKVEGGFVNDPLDRGGATNYGITLQTLSDYNGYQATVDDIQNIDLETVKSIYKKNYWDRLHLDFVEYVDLAHFMFDQAVNRGTRKVAEQIQKIVGVEVIDGIVGAKTLNAINNYNPRELLIKFIIESQNSYISIVNSNPTQLKFLSGWIKRTHHFLK